MGEAEVVRRASSTAPCSNLFAPATQRIHAWNTAQRKRRWYAAPRARPHAATFSCLRRSVSMHGTLHRGSGGGTPRLEHGPMQQPFRACDAAYPCMEHCTEEAEVVRRASSTAPCSNLFVPATQRIHALNIFSSKLS